MAITYRFDGGQYVNEQGTTLPLLVVKSIPSSSDGSVVTDGRKSAAASRSVALSTEDKAALDAAKAYYSTASIYVNNTARAAGIGIMAVITTAGTATLTLGGVDIVMTFAVGPTILPLAITKTVLGTAVGNFYALG